MVISKFSCNRSLAFTFRKNLFDFFFCKFIKFIHRYLHVQRVFSNMVRLTRFQRARSLLQKFLRFLCLAFHHKRISRAGLRTCYDLFSHGDSYYQYKPLCRKKDVSWVFTAPMVSRMGFGPTSFRKSFWEIPVYQFQHRDSLLVFPSRHCLRRSLLYFKHHVVHVIIFTIADHCADNILRIRAQLASAKISV